MNLLKLTDVLNRLAVSRPTLYRWIKEGHFPKPIKLADNGAARWTEEEVEEWIAERNALRKAA